MCARSCARFLPNSIAAPISTSAPTPARSGSWRSTAIARNGTNLWRPDSLIGSMGFGPMGFGVAGVLGAKFAAPNRPCVSVCGDGAFFMHANVLGTAVEYDLPVVWVVWNNYAYASIRGLQRGYLGGRELATDFHDPMTGERYNPDSAAMARSAGVEGVRVDRAA